MATKNLQLTGTYADDLLTNAGQKAYVQLAQSYTPRTSEELQALAEAKYTSQYNTDVQNAENTYAQAKTNYDNSVTSTNSNYDKQLATSTAQYSTARDTLTGDMLKRGMGRSSYASSLLYNNGLQEAAAANTIEQGRSDAIAALDNELATAGTTRQNALNTAESTKAASVANYVSELEDEDYERQTAANTANTTLLEWLLNQKRYRRSSSSSSSSSKKTTTTTTNTDSNTKTYGGLTLADSIAKSGAYRT